MKLDVKSFSVPNTLQVILNSSLIFLSFILSVLLIKEIYHFSYHVLLEDISFSEFLEEILFFFLYFEFISMIVKYFRENYHFPLRYFIYIGITAMVRLIIVNHNNPTETLYYAVIILVLIISYYIINVTPRERP